MKVIIPTKEYYVMKHDIEGEFILDILSQFNSLVLMEVAYEAKQSKRVVTVGSFLVVHLLNQLWWKLQHQK